MTEQLLEKQTGQNEGIDLEAAFQESHIQEILDKLDQELVGLKSVKNKIREMAALLLVDRIRKGLGLNAGAPSLHMTFLGNPGMGKTTVAMRMAEILYRLEYIRKENVMLVTRDDLVGQGMGQTGPKTREVLNNAMGGVLLIDEAYTLYRPDYPGDFGLEAIEILMQVM
ncbi:AAA family ATPase, partial [Dolichospermum circinale CS-537/05]|nr:AAA family ATPase [Dolichospermum circinale CS-537/05]